MKRHFFTLLMLITVSVGFSQQQGVCISADNSQPDASAILDVKSTSQGVLFPRISSTQRDAIISPAAGLMIFNTSRKCIEYFTGISWESSVPAGTIQPFGGSSTEVPDGWMLCNGTAIDREEFKDLYQAIGIRYGAGNNQTTFNLPDLRGMFLRGANNGRTDEYKDPDVDSRTANGLGNKDDAGSKQSDAFQGHHHELYGKSGGGTTFTNTLGTNPASSYKTLANQSFVETAISDGINGTTRISSESRSKNMYVNYIIKF